MNGDGTHSQPGRVPPRLNFAGHGGLARRTLGRAETLALAGSFVFASAHRLALLNCTLRAAVLVGDAWRI